MGIKQYIVFSVFLLAIVGIYVYSIIPNENAYYTLTFFRYSWELPIAVWFIIPIFVLFIASVIHMLFYSVKNFLTKRLTKKDYETLVLHIKHTLLGEEKDFEYRTEPFKILAAAIKKMKYNPKSADENTGEKELDEVFKILEKIKNGEYVDLKKFRLRSDNEILNQNRLNFPQDDKKSIDEILKHCSSLDNEVCEKAFYAFLKRASYSDIKNYNFNLTGDMLLILFERFADKSNDFTLSNAEIKELLEKTSMNSGEFLNTAKVLKTVIEPDTLLKLYDNVQSKNQHAAFSYLYILFELRLIDKVRDFLDNNEEGEFEKFRILLFLRDNGKIVDTDLII
ncbi:MAG: hypothetical protein LBH45_03075 [Campylobacteraceae bacterium]|jgi:hypothetical protein|nr:hypothetical protein [Campylobacteraceae bacterium]